MSRRQLVLLCLAVVLYANLIGVYTVNARPAELPVAQTSPLSPLAAPTQVKAAEVAPGLAATPLPVPAETLAPPQLVMVSPILLTNTSSAITAATTTVTSTETATVIASVARGSQTSLTLVGLVLVGVLLVVGVVASRQR